MEVTVTHRAALVHIFNWVSQLKKKNQNVHQFQKACHPDSALILTAHLKLLALPRDVGIHPEDGKVIKAAIGRFGPYVSHSGAFASLKDPEDVFNIGINHAVTLMLAETARKTRQSG